MKTFLVLVFCLLVIDHGDALGLGLGVSLDLLPTIDNWIVIMHRFDGTLSFNQEWNQYRDGFGKIGEGEFWLGNKMVHHLTTGDVYTLRIEMYADVEWYYAEYAIFSLDSEENKYALRLSGFSGDAGDSLTNTSAWAHWYHGGMTFSAPDLDNENNCAKLFKAGWWFNGCFMSCLTCQYGTDFVWGSLNHLPSKGRLLAARMMITRKNA